MKLLFLIPIILFISCNKETKTITPELKSTSLKNDSKENDLEIYDYSGLEPLLNKKDDNIYVVNFWATWCAPCVKELPAFEKLNELHAKDNIKVVLVSLDFPKQYDTKLKPFIKKHALKSKVVVLNDPDSNSWINKISSDWSGAIPATLIYNKNKSVFYEQSFDYLQLKAAVEKFNIN